jgi:hypothetical protein
MSLLCLILGGWLAKAESHIGLNVADLLLYPLGTGIFERIVHFRTPPDVMASKGVTVPVEWTWSRPLNPNFDFVLHGFYRFSSLIVVRSSHQVALLPGFRYWFQRSQSGWMIQEGMGLGYWQLTPSPFGNNTIGLTYNFSQLAFVLKVSAGYVWPIGDRWHLQLGLGGSGFFRLLGTEFKVSPIAESTHFLFRLTPHVMGVVTYRFGDIGVEG